MIITLSPAKSVDFKISPTEEKIFSSHSPISPLFPDETKFLADILKKKSAQDLQTLMKISPKLGDMNHERFQIFGNKKNFYKPALWSFTGQVYKGFDLKKISDQEIIFAQKHLKILSGLYGIISPLTLIQPYRLEMGTKLEFTLYEYWKKKVTQEMITLLKKEKYWLNLASVEYASVIDRKEILKNNGQIIDVDFRVEKNGTSKIIAIFAKQQRGRLSNWIIQNAIIDPSQIKQYTNDGFLYSKKLSSPEKLVFLKKGEGK